MADYLEFHYSGEDTTVEEFLADNESLINNMTKQSFLSSGDSDGITNLKLIWSLYSPEEIEENKVAYSSNNLSLLKRNTVLFIPTTNLHTELISINGKNLFLKQEKGQKAWFQESLSQLQSEPTFVKLDSVTKHNNSNDVNIINENIQVWVWMKSIDKIINLSPMITDLTTSKGDVGSFNFSINPFSLNYQKDTGSISPDFVNDYKSNLVNIMNININQFNKNNISNYIQYNDIVFIRFEKLQIEETQIDKNFGFEVSKNDLPYQFFDMIALVDNVTTSINAVTTDSVVSVSGRDLMKLFIEDGSYFMPFRFIEGDPFHFFNIDTNSKFFKRNFQSGSYDYMFAYDFRSISSVFGFIVNHISNLGITGDSDLFSSYENKRTKAYKLQTIDNVNSVSEREVKGIWQIVKFSADEKVESRRIADPSISSTDATLLDQMNKVCQKPFVEFWGDTYSSYDKTSGKYLNEFDFIVRQPPFDKSMRDVINTPGLVIPIEDKDIYQIDLSWETEFYSWFQIQPDNIFAGDNKWAFASYLPIVFSDEIAEYFGNHRKIIQDIYISAEALNGDNKNSNFDLFKNSVLNDLKYLIESHIYLPFTRRGNIIINGDRRIKKGSFVELKYTGEICYVDSVSNHISFNKGSIDRTTVLNVSRCMVKKYIFGNIIGGEGIEGMEVNLNNNGLIGYNEGGIKPIYDNFSYFDIVDTELIYTQLLQKVQDVVNVEDYIKPKEQVATNFGTNPEVFKFFLERRQFE